MRPDGSRYIARRPTRTFLLRQREAVITAERSAGLTSDTDTEPAEVRALYCTVLYCTVLYCTVLYCTGEGRQVLDPGPAQEARGGGQGEEAAPGGDHQVTR